MVNTSDGEIKRYVEFKCVKCGHKETIDSERARGYFYCPECGMKHQKTSDGFIGLSS
ncbi:MAG: hypothetical protein FWH54_00115 [Methanobrevibacter sp.]|nr:hypothetical protein [Methanobrevibacter sp.]